VGHRDAHAAHAAPDAVIASRARSAI